MLQDLRTGSPAGLVEWLRPADLPTALSLVEAGATPVGGGAALLSRAFPLELGDRAVDVVPLLPGGVRDGVIGAATTLAALAVDPVVVRKWPALAAAAQVTATPQVRAVAGVGGTVAARLPTADLAAAMAAYDCTVLVMDAAGSWEWPVLDHLSSPTLPRHLVLGIRPRLSGPGAYRRFARQVGPAPAIATVAGADTEHGRRLFAGAVGLTAAPVPLAADGSPLQDLRSDARAGASYRRQLIAVLAADVRRRLDGAA
jgi:CO/xanthine dehydrogenase FAD-binding subunit